MVKEKNYRKETIESLQKSKIYEEKLLRELSVGDYIRLGELDMKKRSNRDYMEPHKKDKRNIFRYKAKNFISKLKLELTELVSKNRNFFNRLKKCEYIMLQVEMNNRDSEESKIIPRYNLPRRYFNRIWGKLGKLGNT